MQQAFLKDIVVDLLPSWAAAGTRPEEDRRMACFFDDHHEGIGPGWFAEQELQSEMTAFFEQFRDDVPLLPTAPLPRPV
jgi:hypothetical protein